MFESEFEQREYEKRQQNLKEIVALVQQSHPGLPDVAAAYPNAFLFTHTIPQIRADYDSATAETLEAAPIPVAIAGRIMAHRAQGKAGFAQLQQDGQRLQIYAKLDLIGDTAFQLYKSLHLGDHIGVTGTLFRTRTGELTVQVATLTFLAAAMLPLPSDYYGIEDIEQRYRRRYVDLIMNQDVRATFVKRAAVLRALRTFFDARGFLEVETPMMHTISGGAAARPFETHHNALDIPLKLRIAPELYLKRLVVGGFDRVYEINRNFRNEGVSTQHNPEFTMLEFYQAYANYHDLMDLTEEIIKFVAQEVNGTTKTNFPIPKGPRAGEVVEIDLANWTKLSMREAIIKWWGGPAGTEPTLASFDSVEGMAKWIKSFNLPANVGFITKRQGAVTSSFAEELGEFAASHPYEPCINHSNEPDNLTRFGFYVMTAAYEYAKVADGVQPLGKAIATIFEEVAEFHLIQPTIIYDFPLAVSPLSKVKPDEPDWVERFEFYIGGFEVGNAFSELNDPEDQRRRFEAQVADKDPESMAEVDHDYVRALGYGLPPTAGEGIGIDRLTMILTGAKSIRDVILFPLLRPQTKATQHQGDLPPAEPQTKPIK